MKLKKFKEIILPTPLKIICSLAIAVLASFFLDKGFGYSSYPLTYPGHPIISIIGWTFAIIIYFVEAYSIWTIVQYKRKYGKKNPKTPKRSKK